MRVATTPARFGAEEIDITTSVGLATTVFGTHFEALVVAADAALYLAKDNGRNRVESSDTLESFKPDHSEASVVAC